MAAQDQPSRHVTTQAANTTYNLQVQLLNDVLARALRDSTRNSGTCAIRLIDCAGAMLKHGGLLGEIQLPSETLHAIDRVMYAKPNPYHTPAILGAPLRCSSCCTSSMIRGLPEFCLPLVCLSVINKTGPGAVFPPALLVVTRSNTCLPYCPPRPHGRGVPAPCARGMIFLLVPESSAVDALCISACPLSVCLFTGGARWFAGFSSYSPCED